MRHRGAWALPLAALITLALAACSPALVTLAPDTPTPAGPPTPAPSPTPRLTAEITMLTTLPAPEGDGWIVIGLVENQSAVSSGEVWVKVRLGETGAEEASEQEVLLALPHLGPGETAPFSAFFAVAGAPSEATAEVSRYVPAEFERPLVDVGDLSVSPTADGRLAVLGTVVNGSSEAIDVHEIALLATDADGSSLALATATAHRARLEPGSQGPFLAFLPAGLQDAALNPFVDATVISSAQPPRLTFLTPPRVLEDEQGDPFVIGVIRNGDSRPRWASVLVSLSFGGGIVGVAQVVAPVPLGPGESRPFTATEFPGLTSGAEGLTVDGLEVDAWVDPLPALEAGLRLVPQAVHVTSFEAIGGTLFLQGTVENDTGARVISATVLAAVRSTEGLPLTAGWRVAAESLEAGESAAFVLELTLPRGADLAMSEYDVVASALAPSD